MLGIVTPKVSDIYKLQEQGNNIFLNDLVFIAFQDEKSTARTLEEAMFNKLLEKDVFSKMKRSEWIKIKNDNKLTFTIPNNRDSETDSSYSIQEIVKATSNNKTDSMYSVILSGNEIKMLPDYIKEGLLWLAM